MRRDGNVGSRTGTKTQRLSQVTGAIGRHTDEPRETSLLPCMHASQASGTAMRSQSILVRLSCRNGFAHPSVERTRGMEGPEVISVMPMSQLQELNQTAL